jgi:hypothetical protein
MCCGLQWSWRYAALCSWLACAGGEISALKADDLDWRTPKIMVRRTWQAFDKKTLELGPTKGKKNG